MMNSKVYLLFSALVLVFVLTCGITSSEGADKKEIKCKIEFSLRGWSAFYQTASGAGSITCDNGQTAKVKLQVKGGGLTVGKSSLTGKGTFSDVSDISELFGPYAKAEAHAGVVKSANAQVVTKGDVSLAITAKGRGIDLGIAFGEFRIDPVGKKSGK